MRGGRSIPVRQTAIYNASEIMFNRGNNNTATNASGNNRNHSNNNNNNTNNNLFQNENNEYYNEPSLNNMANQRNYQEAQRRYTEVPIFISLNALSLAADEFMANNSLNALMDIIEELRNYESHIPSADPRDVRETFGSVVAAYESLIDAVSASEDENIRAHADELNDLIAEINSAVLRRTQSGGSRASKKRATRRSRSRRHAQKQTRRRRSTRRR